MSRNVNLMLCTLAAAPASDLSHGGTFRHGLEILAFQLNELFLQTDVFLQDDPELLVEFALC